jgi:hypothetical protein
MSDILYYSNHCKHCQKIIQFLSKNGLAEKLSFICLDKRVKDPKTGYTNILLENGKKVLLPPNIHSVPSLLLTKQNYKVVLGDDIIALFQPKVQEQNEIAQEYQGEPSGFSINTGSGGMNIVSEQYTYYNMSPEELSAKGKGNMRQLHNYVKATHEPSFINTPPDNYRPDKIASGITVETLQQKRMDDVSPTPSMI